VKKHASIPILLVLALSAGAPAMTLDANSIAVITTDPNAQPWDSFSACKPAKTVVWIDGRRPDYVQTVYGVRLDDPTFREFIIDPCAADAREIAGAAQLVVYTPQGAGGSLVIRVADITDVNHPVLRDVPASYPGGVDVSGTVAVAGVTDPNTWLQSVQAYDLSDINDIRAYTIYSLTPDESLSGITIDGHYAVWVVYNYSAGPYVCVADLTDLADPVILTAQLPAQMDLQEIDASDDWLVVHGWRDYRSFVGAVYNYKNTSQWNIQTIWREGDNGESYISGPRIDGTVAVWVTTTRMPSGVGLMSLDSPEWMLKAACLGPSGSIASSELRRSTSEHYAADIVDGTVIWSELASEAELYKAELVFECGDWGYEYGDLNRDCYVDFKDFAIFADGWLKCTMPNVPGCGYGPPR
jgi:hypothetical protein